MAPFISLNGKGAFAMGDLLQPMHLFVLGIACLFVYLPLVFVPKIFYILTIQKTLHKCAPEVCSIDPGTCWLFLIPLVSTVWHFFMMNGVSRALAAEFARRGVPFMGEQPGHDIGLAMCIVGACVLVPGLCGLAFPAYLVLWILYWMKINEFSRRLDLPVSQPGSTVAIS
jgi:hypothetical protein